MGTITTEAWVLYQGDDTDPASPGLRLETYSFPEITDSEVLVEPIYGCWEANMSHALQRRPIDICRQRQEQAVVIGNSGVVRILRAGPGVTTLREGQLCLLDGNVIRDKHGYTLKVLAYDAPNTMGLLAKRSKMPAQCLIPLPTHSTFSAQEWAAFSVRYLTAWDNWKVAWGCWQAQMQAVPAEEVHVWGWGGGVSLAQLAIAKHVGCKTAMISSSRKRLALIQQMGIHPIDRGDFADLSFDPERLSTDSAYRTRYLDAETRFLNLVEELTGGEGVSIFIDNIGAPVFRATLKALGRQGVIATSGWKHGMNLSLLRGVECIRRHIHVNTHGSRDIEAHKAVQAAEALNWRPPVAGESLYSWDEVPRLAREYEAGLVESYFPIYEVNPL